MKNKFQKVNWRRFFALFSVFMVFCSVLVCVVPVSAATSDWYHDEPADFGLPGGLCPSVFSGIPNGSYAGSFAIFLEGVLDYANLLIIDGQNWRFYMDDVLVDSQTYTLSPPVFFTDPSSLGDAVAYLKYVYCLDYVFSEDISSLIGDFSFISYSSLEEGEGFYPALVGGQFSFADGEVGNYILQYEAGGADGMVVVYENGWIDEGYRHLPIVSALDSTSLFALVWNQDIGLVVDRLSFFDRVTSGLTSVIGWVGVVASAVISGPLSPLLGLVAVGIALSAILLVIYLVRRFIWGA